MPEIKLVVYNIFTGAVYARYSRLCYKTAQRKVDAINNQERIRNRPDLVKVGTPEEAELLGSQMVIRTNLMTGKKYLERRDTPAFLSPACESYWSM